MIHLQTCADCMTFRASFFPPSFMHACISLTCACVCIVWVAGIEGNVTRYKLSAFDDTVVNVYIIVHACIPKLIILRTMYKSVAI